MPVSRLQQWLGQDIGDLPGGTPGRLQLNSRAVKPGDIFLALPGTKQHGNRYIGQALEQGALLVLTDDAAGWTDARIKVLPDLSAKLPQLAAAFYQYPQQHVQLLGVTGTNGKSSTTFFISQLLQQLGVNSSVIGTLGYGADSGHLTYLQNTTPHYVDIQAILADFVAAGVKAVAMEVSSHALAQQRVAGLQFQVAVFTNLTRDHLDYHGSMEAYAAAKSLLFQPDLAQAAVINVSDPYGKALAAQTSLPLRVYGKLEDCVGYTDYLAYEQVTATASGYQFWLSSPAGRQQCQLPLYGEFNIQNVLAAISSLLALGYALESVLQVVPFLEPVPGRMEQFTLPDAITVVVDFAHTPDSLQQALHSLRLHCDGELWCVFGCGGDRDKGKRPLMGRIAEQNADHIIITSDNPRTEDMLRICLDIADGITDKSRYQIEPDRKTAIRQAINHAAAGDIVLLAGKGHETMQIIGTDYLPYDERAYVRQLTAGATL